MFEPSLAPISILVALSACGGSDPAAGGADPSGASPTVIAVDGSSTVFPITEAVAEEFQARHALGKQARVTVGVSGTGGGMKKFCAGELAITGASRTMKPSEAALCSEAGIEYIELPVAYDGISVVVHPDNTFVDHLTTAELAKMWSPDGQGTLTSWSQVRDGFPDEPLALFGPGVDSGTFDYFTKVIVGESGKSRGDYTASEDDNVLVHGVAGDPHALGFFGFAYYAENQGKLRAVPIRDGDAAPVSPTRDTINDLSYAPLSRPIYIYVARTAADRPDVAAFVEFYLTEGGPLADEVGYVALSDAAATAARKRFVDRTTGLAKQ